MPECFYSEHLLTNISTFLNPNEIALFQSCNKTIKAKLNPMKNPTINVIFYYYTTQKFFNDEDLDEESIHDRKKIIENSWISSINWKIYYNQIFLHFKIYPDVNISTKFLDAFKIHIYLLDIRKENYHLEFASSTVHQLINYDKKFREKLTYNFYEKYINDNYISHNGNDYNIKILKEGLSFENELINYINIYNDIICHEEYKLIIEKIINYDFEELDKFYEKINVNKMNNTVNNNINNIIYFILWSNRTFKMSCMYIYESIARFEDDKNVKNFLMEYITQYKNYVNSCLIINSNFENINIIVNYLNKFVLKKNTEEKFSLYELSRKIFNKEILEHFYDKILKKTSILLINLFYNIFDNKIEIKKENEEMDQNETNNTSNSYMELDEFFSEYNNNEKTDKEIIEDIFNNILDMNINKENSNAINHSRIKLDKEYDQLENILIQRMKEALEAFIHKDKPLLQLIQNIEELLKTEDDVHHLKYNPYSFKLINRTKKKMLEESFKILDKIVLNELKKDLFSRIKIENDKRTLYVKNNELINNIKYEYDLSIFSNKKRMEIEGQVDTKLKNIKTTLFEDIINGFGVDDTAKLVNEYMDNNRIDLVLLTKKIIYFYCKESELYVKKDEKIYNILANRNKSNNRSSLNDIIIN